MLSIMDTEEPSPGIRFRVLAAASDLVAKNGIGAVTTRGVAAAAGVQAPTLYRLFGDKDGLLDALAEHQLAAYLAGKARREPSRDPVENFTEAWDAHIAFGLGHPAAFAIMQGPRRGGTSAAMRAGIGVLRERIRLIARVGRLRVAEDRAVALVHAAGTGVIATLLALPQDERDPGLATAVRSLVLEAILGEAPDREQCSAVTAAVTLRAQLDDTKALTPGERMLMAELLDRIAS